MGAAYSFPMTPRGRGAAAGAGAGVGVRIGVEVGDREGEARRRWLVQAALTSPSEPCGTSCFCVRVGLVAATAGKSCAGKTAARAEEGERAGKKRMETVLWGAWPRAPTYLNFRVRLGFY